jgi:hypothetical protein
MGWNAALNEQSALGSSILFTPNTSSIGEYTVSTFTAPRKGVYRFELKGSGGAIGSSSVTELGGHGRQPGGEGGSTDGYLLLEKGQTVYIGAGGLCSAAFVSNVTGGKLSEIAKDGLYFVAGGGGQGGAWGDSLNNTGWNCVATEGGNGGGTNGASSSNGGKGGTQSAGGAPGGSDIRHEGTAGTYGTGGTGSLSNWENYRGVGGRGGDGLYGGGGGNSYTHISVDPNYIQKSGRGFGGGGGSGYVKTPVLTVRNKTYTSSTKQGGGASSGGNGSVKVTYFARTELPVRFDGAIVERLFFNGTEIGSLVYNGAKVFMRRWMRCLQYPGGRSACPAGTRELFPSA